LHEGKISALRKSNSLPFKGRARVGMGSMYAEPIPLPTSPLKGEETIATLKESNDE